MTRTASTADTIVQSLISHGVDTVFGIPGVQTYPLFDAMARSGLRVIGARHEQTVAYMAFGYAQATGRTGVYSVVPGPGFLNSSAALISAYGASAPEALEATLTKALADGRPAVIEVKTTIGEAAATPWKYLMPGRK